MDLSSASDPATPEDSSWPGTWEPLGATVSGSGTNMALWAEGAEAVEVCLFDEDNQESRIALHERTFGVFHGFLPAVGPGHRYGFRVHGPWDPANGRRFNAAKLLMDPYARAITGAVTSDPAIYAHLGEDDLAINPTDSAPFVPRSVIVRDHFDWGTDSSPAVAWGDTVIYEAHVKGLTMRHPGVPEHLRGTYAAVGHPAIIDYLVRLGITSIELLPVHHSVPEIRLIDSGLTNYWGYNSLSYFAPHAAYSASGTNGQQVTEFKAMVKALHEAGIEVILDVVYNHTCEASEIGPSLCYRGVDNLAYYRVRDNGRRYTDYTGCGNTLDMSHPHVLRLVMDSLRYWVTEMHVDGFRFDLASALARSFHDVDMLGNFMTTISQDPVLRNVKLIAEPWDVGDGGYQVGEFPPLWTEWNDKYRGTVRDFWRGASNGVQDLGWRLSGSADLYAEDGRRPYASVNFVTAHDGFTMRDLVSYDQKHNEANGEDNRDGTDDNRSANYGAEGDTADPAIVTVRQRQVRNLLTMLILSTGVPMITAGDEFGRTQGGNNNPYCQDNEISWVDWDFAPWQRDLLATAQTLISLRSKHPAFRRRYFFEGRPVDANGIKDLAWLDSTGAEFDDADWNSGETRTFGMYINGHVGHRDARGQLIVDDSFLLLFNAADHDVPFTLPGKPFGVRYRRLIDTADAKPKAAATDDTAGHTITLTARSSMVYRVEAE